MGLAISLLKACGFSEEPSPVDTNNPVVLKQVKTSEQKDAAEIELGGLASFDFFDRPKKIQTAHGVRLNDDASSCPEGSSTYQVLWSNYSTTFDGKDKPDIACVKYVNSSGITRPLESLMPRESRGFTLKEDGTVDYSLFEGNSQTGYAWVTYQGATILASDYEVSRNTCYIDLVHEVTGGVPNIPELAKASQGTAQTLRMEKVKGNREVDCSSGFGDF
jgi:hypothetical protein